MAGLTISKLENMLRTQRDRKAELMKERGRLLRQLEKLDQQVALIDGGSGGGGGAGGPNGTGGGGGGGGSRVRNERSLPDVLEDVLSKGPAEGMQIGEILKGVQEAGYKSNAANFRGIINQMLIKEKKRFKQVSRGVYGLKK